MPNKIGAKTGLSGTSLINEGSELKHFDDTSQSALKDVSKRQKVINSPFLHKMQVAHFVRYDVLPAIATLIAICVVVFVPSAPFGLFELGLFLGMWWVTGMAITVGYHRLFTHRSFKTKRWIEMLLVICGSMAGQGSYVSWAALHRRHHELSDRPGDPHSPNLHGCSLMGRFRGLLHAHLTWMAKHEYPSVVHYTPDLLGDPVMMRLDRYYQYWVFLGLAIPTALGGLYHGTFIGALQGFFWGGAVRMFFLEHTIWAINSFLHVYGKRQFETRDGSRNSHLFAFLTFGEAFHNNHHAFPGSAWFSLSWWKFDPAYAFIRALEAVGLAWDVKVPTAEMISKRKSRVISPREPAHSDSAAERKKA